MELISREQAIDALRGYLVGKRCPDDGTLTCRLIENEVINKLPTIHSEPGTNLAEVGMDRVVKGFPIDADDLMLRVEEKYGFRSRDRLYDIIRKMPKYELASIQPDIIYCKDCEKHNKGVGDFEITPDGKRTWIWKDRACPLVSWRGSAQGHEFDYQFCVYGERREVTT